MVDRSPCVCNKVVSRYIGLHACGTRLCRGRLVYMRVLQGCVVVDWSTCVCNKVVSW